MLVMKLISVDFIINEYSITYQNTSDDWQTFVQVKVDDVLTDSVNVYEVQSCSEMEVP